MIARNSLRVRWGHLLARASLLLLLSWRCCFRLWLWLHDSLLLSRKMCVWCAIDSAVALSALLSASRLRLDVVVGDVAALDILRDFLIGGIGRYRNDVPCVEEAGEIGETAERDVDQTVGGADAWRMLVCCERGSVGVEAHTSLYPNRDWGKEDGNDAKEDIAAAHGGGGPAVVGVV